MSSTIVEVDWEKAGEAVKDAGLEFLATIAGAAKEQVDPDGTARKAFGFIVEGTRTGDAEMVRQARNLVPVVKQTLAQIGAHATDDAIMGVFTYAANLLGGAIGQFLPKLGKPSG